MTRQNNRTSTRRVTTTTNANERIVDTDSSHHDGCASKRRESKMQSERHRRSKITGLINLIAKVLPTRLLPVGYVSCVFENANVCVCS